MTIEKFNEEYADKGGMEMLRHLMSEAFTVKYIGEHFGVSVAHMQEMVKDMFNEGYDPRQKRKERIIQSMIDFAIVKKMTEKDFRDAYYYASKNYFDAALAELRNRGIF